MHSYMEANNWINVKDKAIPEGEELIFCKEGWSVEQGFFQDGMIFTYGCRRLEKELMELEPVMLDSITHWIPKPPPPTKEVKNDE